MKNDGGMPLFLIEFSGIFQRVYSLFFDTRVDIHISVIQDMKTISARAIGCRF